MNFEALNKQKCKIGNISFTINKLNAFEAEKVFGLLRVDIVKVFGETENGVNDMMSIITALMAIPQHTLDQSKNMLFPNCTYCEDGNTYPVAPKLETHLFDHVFQKLDLFDIYELLARCLVVNFFSSFVKFNKLQERLSLATQQEEQSESVAS